MIKPYKLPNKKKNVLKKEVLTDFRDDLSKLQNNQEWI